MKIDKFIVLIVFVPTMGLEPMKQGILITYNMLTNDNDEFTIHRKSTQTHHRFNADLHNVRAEHSSYFIVYKSSYVIRILCIFCNMLFIFYILLQVYCIIMERRCTFEVSSVFLIVCNK